MTAKTHTQKTTTYFGSDLRTGMTLVDGYGNHYLITGQAAEQEWQDGYLSIDWTRTTLTLAAAGASYLSPFPVGIDNSEEFDVLDA